MDPPNSLFSLNSQKLKADMRVVLETYFINLIILSSLIFLVIIFLNKDDLANILAEYKKQQWAYFRPINISDFIFFLNYQALNPAIYEEIIWRGPIWFLIYYGFKARNNFSIWIYLLVISLSVNYGFSLHQTFLTPLIVEEINGRGPLKFLTNYQFELNEIHATWFILLIASMCLNYSWAVTHTFGLPIFLVGIPAYIALIRTKNIFVPIFCHFISNMSLYILAQALLYTKFI